ncbi:ABC transporter substrate-binding protein [Paenibacillus sp. J5C2022]|uniref:ABC transporter substrate-binding protein n=1 Tax=Paenibacillus sp. J5C2022 TaxID=2977129 RepID=UPI0021CE9B66|nr:ABC transporter substrate-binding protein [Paenibacillus sp. J5C2022]
MSSLPFCYMTDLNLEAIVAANPDLIFAGPTQEKIIGQLEKIAPTVLVPHGFDAFRERFAFIAEVMDKQTEMEEWMKAYEERAEQLHKEIKNVICEEHFAVIGATTKELHIYSTTGVADMIFGDLKLPMMPGTPEADYWGGIVADLEILSTFEPDHIVLIADNENNMLEQSAIWSSMKAVKEGNVYRMTNRQNYNEAFYALGKKKLIEELAVNISGK